MTDPRALERLRDAERAKRLLLLGAAAILYGSGWMVFDHHATRVAGAVGTVSRVYQKAWYTVDHVFEGVAYAADLGRIPDSMARPPVGGEIQIYFYRNDPTHAFYEPRRHASPGPIPAAVALLGLVAVGEGLRRALRSRGRPAESGDTWELPLSRMHWIRGLVGGIFFVLLSLVVGLSMWLGWHTGGPMGLFTLVFVVGTHGGLAGAVFVIAYVSGLVFDPGRGLIYHRWGLRRPCMRSFRPLSDLARLETRTVLFRRGRSSYLVLHFQDGSESGYPLGARLENPAETEGRLRQFLESRSITLP
ncbi:MAG TPA: hypothetical protein VF950_23910 [Planctomycetota bacterium]